jgi:uncharacterized protein (DUF1697 family)
MRNEKLRGVLEELGFDHVRSVISSGNVLFEADSTNADALEAKIQAAWPERLGFESTTILRTRGQLERLIADNPFGDTDDVKTSRLQATFLKHDPDKKLDLPHSPPGGDYTVVAIVDRTSAR